MLSLAIYKNRIAYNKLKSLNYITENVKDAHNKIRTLKMLIRCVDTSSPGLKSVIINHSCQLVCIYSKDKDYLEMIEND